MNKKIIIIIAIMLVVLGSLVALSAYAFQQLVNEEFTIIQPAPAKIIPLPNATEIENRVNAYRSEKGLTVLADNTALDQAAGVRADNICAANDWSHTGDWTVLQQYYSYSFAGENLYYGTLQEDQARVAVADWIASPEHLANIVGNYSEFGIAVKSCPGFQGGANSVIITNFFGVPR